MKQIIEVNKINLNMSGSEDMLKFVTCVQCKQVPKEPPLFSCKEGHIICEFCFEAASIGKNKTCMCRICGNRIISKNIFGAEELLKVFGRSSMNSDTFVKVKKSRSKTSSIHQVNKSNSAQKTISRISVRQSASFINVSRRPIYCPNTECSKMITVTQLISHFQFDHSKIPQEGMEFNQPKTLVLNLTGMDYGKSHCIALLLISEEKDNFSLGISQSLNDNGIAFPLLAAKLRCKPEFKSGTTENSSTDSKKILHRNGALQNAQQWDYSDIVIIWICGNVDYNIKCLIEVSDEKQTRIYSYYGSINSLRDSNDPNDVFLRADCLLLHSSNVVKITQNGNYPMDLKVLISCPFEQLV